MKQVIATNFGNWRRVGISQCPVELASKLGMELTEQIIHGKKIFTIDEIHAPKKQTVLFHANKENGGITEILDVIKEAKKDPSENLAVWLSIREDHVSSLTEKISGWGYSLEITEPKFVNVN